MDKSYKYEKLAKIFFKRLVIIERDINVWQKELEKISNNNFVKIFLETKDIIPLLDIVDVVGIEDNDKGDGLYNEIIKITNKTDDERMDEEIENIFKKYL